MNRNGRVVLSTAVALVLVAFSATASGPVSAPKTYGTTNVTWYRMSALEFVPVNAASAPTTTWAPTSTYNFRTYGGGGWFFATPHLPNGALLTMLELNACDTNSTGNHLELTLWDCDFNGACNSTPIGTTSTFDLGPGCGAVYLDISAANYTVDNQVRELLLWAKMDVTDGTNQLSGAAVGYKLQVSPAPATPTFNDVPTTDPGFQFIEALAASGITGGCGGGNYCPDNPVTRRQMAVFFAKALGLSF